MTARQSRVLERLAGDSRGDFRQDFTGKLTCKKYAKLAKCSEEDAAADLRQLVDAGVFVQVLQGREPHYVLRDPDQECQTTSRHTT